MNFDNESSAKQSRELLEKIKMRSKNRHLLYAVLGDHTISFECISEEVNLRSQEMLRTALRVIDQMIPESYTDMIPAENHEKNGVIENQKQFLHDYRKASEAYHFIEARKIMIQAVRELDMEQCHTLAFFQAWKTASLYDTDHFRIIQSDAALPKTGSIDYQIENLYSPLFKQVNPSAQNVAKNRSYEEKTEIRRKIAKTNLVRALQYMSEFESKNFHSAPGMMIGTLETPAHFQYDMTAVSQDRNRRFRPFAEPDCSNSEDCGTEYP